MRVAIGGIIHETNTYADKVTGLTQEVEFDQLYTDDYRAHVVEAGLASGGFLEAAADLGWEAVPTYYAFAQVRLPQTFAEACECNRTNLCF